MPSPDEGVAPVSTNFGIDSLGEREERYVSPVRLSQLYTALSEPELALGALEQAVEARAADLIWADVFPGFEPIRAHPRFLDIRREVFGG